MRRPVDRPSCGSCLGIVGAAGHGCADGRSADAHARSPRCWRADLGSPDRSQARFDSCRGRAPQAWTHVARTDRTGRSSRRLLRAWRVGLALYPKGGVERVDVQMGLGQQLLELGVLALELTQSLGIGHVHAAVVRTPLVEGGVTEAAFAAQLLDRQACFRLPDEPDDLLFGESALSHVRHSPS
jgi:hypothetical protein